MLKMFAYMHLLQWYMSRTESKTVVFRHKKHMQPSRLHGSLSESGVENS